MKNMKKETSIRLNKILTGVLAAVIAGAVVFVGIGSQWFRDWDGFRNLFKHEETAEVDEGYALNSRGETISDGEVHALSSGIIFGSSRTVSSFATTVAPQNTSATVQAVLIPEDATNQKVDFSLEWGEGSWKYTDSNHTITKTLSEYMTVSQSTDGSLQATVTCKKAFGTPIILKVTPRDNPDVYATCQLDYIKRVTVSLSNSTLKFGSDNTITRNVTYSDGTLQGTLTYGTASVKITDAFKNAMTTNGALADSSAQSIAQTETFTSTSVNLTDGSSSSKAYYFVNNTSSGVVTEYGTTTLKNKAINAIIRSASSITDNHATLSQTYTYKYGDVTISSGTLTKDLKFDTSAIVIGVTGITISDDIIF